MDHGRGDLAGIGGSDRDGKEGVVLEGLPGVIEERERNEGRWAEPVAEKRGDVGGGSGVRRDAFRPPGEDGKQLVIGRTGCERG
jgi:hypothetical protein